MKKPLIIHPFLSGVFPIFTLFSHNIEQVLLTEILLPVAMVTGFTFILLLLLKLIFKNEYKAAIMVSVFLLLFFSYGYFRDIVVLLYEKMQIFPVAPGTVVLSFLTIILLVSFYFTRKTRKDLYKLNTLFNFVGFVLVALSLLQIIPYELKTKRLGRVTSTRSKGMIIDKTKLQKNEFPDIYYIIFDRYTSASALEQFFKFDNSDFINFLAEKGFYVAAKSRANYLSTWRSLASSLNLKHITDLVSELGDDYTDMTVLYDMVANNEVAKFLKDKGYKYILVGSVGGSTRRNELADITFNYSFGMPLTDFYLQLIELSILHPLVVKIFAGDARNLTRKRILYQFEKLEEIPSIKGPKFIFAHALIPHEPYVFDSDGELPTKWEIRKRSARHNYLNQLIFANKKIKALVESILSESHHPPIIILQADEGAHALDFSEQDNLITHVRILNAYYLPGAVPDILYPSVTPVNSFRIIFNHYFDTNYRLLEDYTYHAEDRNYPYRFTNITDKVVKYDFQH